MALEVAQGSFAARTSTGLTSISVGFRPRAVILWSDARSATIGTDVRGFIGFYATERFGDTYLESEAAVSWAADSGGANSQVLQTTSAYGLVIVDSDSSSSVRKRASVTSDSTGFSASYSVADSSAATIYYLVLGGDDIESAHVQTINSPSGTGNQSYQAGLVGFQPNLLLSAGVGAGGTIDAINTSEDTAGFISAATSTSERACTSFRFRDGVATTTAEHRLRTDRVIDEISSGNQADLNAFLSTGFQLNWATLADADSNSIHLAIDGPGFKVGTVSSPTADGTQDTTSVGFTPKALFMSGHASTTAIGSTAGTTGRVVIGAAANDDQASTGAAWQDGASSASANLTSWHDNTHVLSSYSPAQASQETAALEDFLTDGFRLNWDKTGTASATRFWYLATGELLSIEPDLLQGTGSVYEPNLAGPVNPELLQGSGGVFEPDIDGGLSQPRQRPQPRWKMVLAEYTGENVCEILDATDREFTFALNRPRTIKFKVPMPNQATVPLLERGEGLIKLYREAELVMTTEITTLEQVGSSDDRSLAVVGTETLWPRLKKRLVGKSAAGLKIETMTDKGQVMHDALDTINDEDDTMLYPGDLVESTTMTGGPWYYKPWTELMLELSQTLNGFEWQQRPGDPDIGGATGVIDIGPFVGLTGPEPTLDDLVREEAIFEYGTGRTNLREYRWITSTEDLVNDGFGLPADYPNSGGLAVVEDQDAASVTARGLREEVIPNDLVDTDLRQALIDEHVAVRAVPRERFLLQPHFVDDTTRVPQFLQDYYIGDIIEGRVNDHGVIMLDAQVRVYQAVVTLSNVGQETVTLTVVDEAP